MLKEALRAKFMKLANDAVKDEVQVQIDSICNAVKSRSVNFFKTLSETISGTEMAAKDVVQSILLAREN